MKNDDKDAIHPPKRNFEIVLTISTNDKNKLYEIFQRCLNDLKCGYWGGKCGGGFEYDEYQLEFDKNEITKEEYEKQWEEFNKIRFGENSFMCEHCGNWSVLKD